MQQLPEHLRNETIDMSSLASDEKLARAREMATELVRLDALVETTETELSSLKEQRLELMRKGIPDLFESIGIDKIGVPSASVDVVVAPYYHANIASDWPEERRTAAFEWLEREGHGDIVKATLQVVFRRDELPLARELEELIRTAWGSANSHPPQIEMNVSWNTLTSLVREQAEAGEEIPLETLGATIGRQAKIKKRK